MCPDRGLDPAQSRLDPIAAYARSVHSEDNTDFRNSKLGNDLQEFGGREADPPLSEAYVGAGEFITLHCGFLQGS